MKKLLQFVAVAGFATLLVGCNSSATYGWDKAGVSRQTTHSYHQDCVYNAKMRNVSANKEKQLVNTCMRKAGFKWVRLY